MITWRGITFLGTVLSAHMSLADVVVPTRTIRANALITHSDLKVLKETLPGTMSDPADIVGMETRRNLYAGRPIRPSDIGPPALVERNQIVTIQFQTGGLLIETEGRALDRGGVGDVLRVINLASRSTVSGRVNEFGAVRVGQ